MFNRKPGRPKIGARAKNATIAFRCDPKLKREWEKYVDSKGFGMSRALEIVIASCMQRDELQGVINAYKREPKL